MERLTEHTARLPTLIVTEEASEPFDRAQVLYLATDCTKSVDDGATRTRALDHLVAGIRDAVVFGAGVETSLDRTVEALLRRRIRTHVALDAVGWIEADAGQRTIATWKRRTVDGTTTDTILRLLTRA